MNKKLKSTFKMYSIIIVALIVTFFCVYSFFSIRFKEITTTDEKSYALSQANQVDNTISSLVKADIKFLESIVAHVLDDNADIGSMANIDFGNIKKENFNNFMFIDSGGKGYDRHGNSVDISGSPHYNYILNNNSSMYMDGEDKIVVTQKITHDNGYSGIVMIIYDIRMMSERLVTSTTFKNDGIFILDANNNIVISSNIKSVGLDFSQYLSSFGEIVEKSSGQSNVSIIEDSDRITRYVSTTGLGINKDWSVAFISKPSYISSTINSVLFVVLICFSAFIILSITLTSIMLYRQIKRLHDLEESGYTDQITGAPNQSKFITDASQILNDLNYQQYAIVKFDIVKFKYINDKFGYEEGNRLLKHIVSILRQDLEENELFARASGDNLLLLLKYKSSEDILKRLSKISKDISSFSSPFFEKYKINLSFGIYKIMDELSSVVSMIDRADIASKRNKGGYEDSYIFYDSLMRDSIIKQKEIENQMRSALEGREFIPYIQPKYDLTTGKIKGAEALVRWQKPYGSLVPPSDFIPIMEKNGFIVHIDLFVLEEICIKMREWIDAGISPVTISVNLSRAHLYYEGIVETIISKIKKYEIPAEYIELELTESMVFENIDALLNVMNGFKAAGISLSMDDFGSGYSSLNLLRDIPVDILKLDRAFLTDASGSDKGRIVIKNIVNMAKELDLKIVCEGVETKEHAEFLRDIGCDMAQGYYFARPMPVDEFEKLIYEG